MTFRQTTQARLGKEGAIPGYTGFIPTYRNHLIGHCYGDSTRRAAACADSLRNNEWPKAIPLTIESRPTEKDYFYAQLHVSGLPSDPKSIRWIASKKKPPAAMTHASGLLDVETYPRGCIGTTKAQARVQKPTLTIPDLPYKSLHMVLQRDHEELQDDLLEVVKGGHHIKGYTGHVHAAQHIFARSYGKTTRLLKGEPANPDTSRKFVDYADNRALVTSAYEDGHPIQFGHFKLMPPGNSPGGFLGIP